VPVVAMMLGVYAWQRRLNRGGALPTAAPSVRAISATFGNTLQVGLPVATVPFIYRLLEPITEFQFRRPIPSAQFP